MRLIGNRRKEHDDCSQVEPAADPRIIEHKSHVRQPLQRKYTSGTMNRPQAATATARPGFKSLPR
jgi:hypothetical protein